MRILAGYELSGYIKLQHNIRAHVIELDEEYAPVSKRFILGDFSTHFEAELRRKGLLIPATQSNDCENFAFRAMLEAQYLHHKTRGLTGVAFGVILYRINGLSGEPHWINWGANWNKTGPIIINLFFYEPLTRKEVFLTQQEANTAEYSIV